MAQKVTRRAALIKLGGAAMAAGLAGVSGIERLAQAAASELRGEPVGPLTYIHCGPTYPGTVYGCDQKYGDEGCADQNWNCPADFAGCPPDVGASVYCNSDNRGTFNCSKQGANDPYGCMRRKFYCNDVWGNGNFTCGDGNDENDFNCDESGADQTFWCKEPVGPNDGFHCLPAGTYTQCSH